jgi:hypothetical protein
VADALTTAVVVECVKHFRAALAAAAYYAFPEEHGGAFASTIHSSVFFRDQTAYSGRRSVSRRAIDSVKREKLEHRVAEGAAEERCQHRLSQCWRRSGQIKSAKNSGHYPPA